MSVSGVTASFHGSGVRRRRRGTGVSATMPIAGGAIHIKSAATDPIYTGLYGEMLKQSLCLFAHDVLGIQIGDHMLEWGDLVATTTRLSVLAARDHGKSTFFTYSYPIWRSVMEPGCEVYLFAKTLEQAMEYLDIIIYGKNNLRGMLDIPLLSDLVPGTARGKDARERKTRTDLRLRNGSRIRCVSYGKAVRGAHPKYVICDDVLNDEDMHSETVRKKNITYFQSAISQMPPPDGQIVVVGTPYHISDLYGWLSKNSEYTFKRYPGIVIRKGKECALFPWRWTLEGLYKKKREIGPVAFGREILCEPITDDISVFPTRLFPPLYDTTITLRPKRSLIKARGLAVYMGVDLALSANVGADYTVIFVIGRDPHDGSHHVLDIIRTKGLGFNKQLKLVEMAAQKYQPNMIFIEANQFQRVFSDEMRRTTDLPIKPFITTAQNKYPLDKGVPGLRILLENEKMVIPRGDPYSIEMTTTWITECSQFGFVDGKLQGIGDHDDTVMAWWMAEEACKAGGFSFAMGDDEETSEHEDVTGSGEDDEDESWKEEMGLTDGPVEEEPETDDDEGDFGGLDAFDDGSNGAL